jgi:hypothetical protein
MLQYKRAIIARYFSLAKKENVFIKFKRGIIYYLCLLLFVFVIRVLCVDRMCCILSIH